MAFELDFYEDPNGAVPVRKWLDGLSAAKQEAARHALTKVLAVNGIGACTGEWGTALSGGLYEFRIRHDANEILSRYDPALLAKIGPLPEEPTLLRIFFAVDGTSLLLLLGGYDKGRDPSKKRQTKEIKIATKRLREHRRRRTGGRRGPLASFRHWWISKARR